MLDEGHEELSQVDDDEDTYTYGSIKGHNFVIACMRPGQPGQVCGKSGAILANLLSKTENPAICWHLASASASPILPSEDSTVAGTLGLSPRNGSREASLKCDMYIPEATSKRTVQAQGCVQDLGIQAF